MGGRTVTGKVERAVRVATRGPEEEGGSESVTRDQYIAVRVGYTD